AKIGVKAEIVSAEFDSIIGTVQTGKADLGASGFTITDERK
ncbi:MAG: transporter substrate-binding domain-containing protein, partial [Victivallales bacterium]|nr:transporter substrate-binding domain-containing protein [Victivallales bacterium]